MTNCSNRDNNSASSIEWQSHMIPLAIEELRYNIRKIEKIHQTQVVGIFFQVHSQIRDTTIIKKK